MRRKQILLAAIEAVTERANCYGKPEQSFERISVLWNGWLKVRKGGDLSPLDVGVMMILFKLGRLNGKEHADTWVDICGYASCSAELETDGDKNEQGNV